MIGFIAGAGIIVRNSIILVDFIELRLRQGMPLEEAVVEAGELRFRPILLTAAAVVVGSLVMLFDPIFQGLAISLMMGSIAAVLLSPLTVPVLYYLIARARPRGGAAARGAAAGRPRLGARSGGVRADCRLPEVELRLDAAPLAKLKTGRMEDGDDDRSCAARAGRVLRGAVGGAGLLGAPGLVPVHGLRRPEPVPVGVHQHLSRRWRSSASSGCASAPLREPATGVAPAAASRHEGGT